MTLRIKSCLASDQRPRPERAIALNIRLAGSRGGTHGSSQSAKIILISGGARGQGAAEARLFVAEGARVVIGDVLDAEGKRLASELGEAAVFVHQDVTREADWDTAIAAASAFGGLHGLVNNAGIYQPKTLMETDAALFERHMRINQLGCFLGMKAVVPLMERSGGGSIANISSVAGLRGSPGAIAYSATKWALRGMTTGGRHRFGAAKDPGGTRSIPARSKPTC